MRSSTFTSFLNCGSQNCTQHSRCITNTKFSGINSSCDICLMHPRTWFVLLATRAPCWLLLSLQSTSTPRSLSAGLLFSHSSPNLYLCPEFLCPRCEIWHLDLLYFIPLTIFQCCYLSLSFLKPSHSLRESTTPSSLVSSANLLMVHSTPASRLFIKILNRTGCGTEPWGTPLVTSHQPDVAPFTTTLWTLPCSQFFTQHMVYLLIPQLDNLFRRMLWGTASKTLWKSRIITSTTFWAGDLIVQGYRFS